MSTPHPTINDSSKDPTQASLPSSSNRRSSFLASLLSINPSPVTPPRHNSLSSSTCSSTPSVSQSLLSLGTNTDQVPRSGSPASSIASPGAFKASPIDGPGSSPNSHQHSLSGSFSSLASSFGWPASAGAAQPIPIPNPGSGSQMSNHGSSPALTGSSAPTRRTSIGAPAFRRAFELPNYSNLYALNDDPQNPSTSAGAASRGRSGSLFSSFGVGDASKRTSGPPRRKLSPMGERMIRDHPF